MSMLAGCLFLRLVIAVLPVFSMFSATVCVFLNRGAKVGVFPVRATPSGIIFDLIFVRGFKTLEGRVLRDCKSFGKAKGTRCKGDAGAWIGANQS